MQSSEFTKQASQFIGCLSAFVNEMRRYESLVHTFPTLSTTASPAGLSCARLSVVAMTAGDGHSDSLHSRCHID